MKTSSRICRKSIKLQKKKRSKQSVLPFVILNVLPVEGIRELVHYDFIEDFVIFSDLVAVGFSMINSSYHYNHYRMIYFDIIKC